MDALPLLYREGHLLCKERRGASKGMDMGKFIVFEGLDGSGKTTQAKLLHGHFLAQGENSLLTWEPTDGPIGRLARSATKGEVSLETETLALLFAADRREHYGKIIAPALESGGIVVCDRYYYSNLAYQGRTDSESISRKILGYNSEVAKAPPHVVFFLDTEPGECMKRISGSRQETGIYENLKALQALRERYKALFSGLLSHENIVIIDTTGKSEEAVFSEVLSHIEPGYSATMTPPLLA